MSINNEKTVLALIVPCYNEEEVLDISNKEFLKILNEMIKDNLISDDSYICYVNDGSKDKSWQMIKDFMKNDKHIKGISFSRNFGHQAAMIAGIKECKADAYITIDADLQEEPIVIRKMVEKFNLGYNVVYGVRSSRKKDTFFKKYASNLFYKIMDILGSQTIKNSSEVRLISDKVAEIIRSYTEKNVYLRGIISSIGFSWTKVKYTRGERVAGETKYPFSKLLSAAIDGLTTTSNKLLGLIFPTGILVSFLSIAFLIGSIIAIFFADKYAFNLFLLFFISLLTAIQLISLSIVAQYIGKIFKDVKNRPTYIIDEDFTKNNTISK